MNLSNTNPKDRLIEDLNAVIQDSEDMLKATANQAGDNVVALRERARRRLDQAKASLHHAQEAAIEKAKAAGQRTDDYVHDHPWQSVGIAAGIGLLVGMLISRR